MLKGLIFCFTIVLISTCTQSRKILATQIKEPDPKSFWYYNPQFELPADSKLNTEKVYFRIVDTDQYGDAYHMFHFYPDGFLMEYSVYNTPEKVERLKRQRDGNQHGYYEVKNDTLSFTTKVYHNHTPTFYKGIIFQDSLLLDIIDYKTKDTKTESFYLHK